MPGHVPGIYVFAGVSRFAWMAGSSLVKPGHDDGERGRAYSAAAGTACGRALALALPMHRRLTSSTAATSTSTRSGRP